MLQSHREHACGMGHVTVECGTLLGRTARRPLGGASQSLPCKPLSSPDPAPSVYILHVYFIAPLYVCVYMCENNS